MRGGEARAGREWQLTGSPARRLASPGATRPIGGFSIPVRRDPQSQGAGDRVEVGFKPGSEFPSSFAPSAFSALAASAVRCPISC